MHDWASRDDRTGSDTSEGLHVGLTVAMIATPREKFLTCRLDDMINELLARNSARYDYLPVVNEGSETGKEVILGLLPLADIDHSMSCGSVREQLIHLSEDNIVGGDGSILEFILDADRRPCRLVVTNSKITGIVTLSDLQKLPVRAALFALLTDFEIIMAEAISRKARVQENWIGLLSENRRQKIHDEIARSRRGDGFVDALLFTQFCDKASIVMKLYPLKERRPSSARDFKNIQSLRDQIAHANEYASSVEDARNLCSVVRTIRELRSAVAAVVEEEN